MKSLKLIDEHYRDVLYIDTVRPRSGQPPRPPTHTPEAIYSRRIRIGMTGTGKSISMGLWMCDCQDLEVPEFGIHGMKVVAVDMLGKLDLAFAAYPINESHPLFDKYKWSGRKTKPRKVKILVPLFFKKQLILSDIFPEGKVPECVQFFSVSPYDLELSEWQCLLNVSKKQLILLNMATRDLTEDFSLADLFIRICELMEAGELSFKPAIEGLPEGTPGLPLPEKIYDKRSGKPLLDMLIDLMNYGFVLPKRWRGIPTPTTLDVRKELLDKKTITILYLPPTIPDYIRYGIATWFLRKILTIQQVERLVPLLLCFPEVSLLAPDQILDREAYKEPLKTLMREIYSQGRYFRIAIDVDTQSPEQFDKICLDNTSIYFLFNVGDVERLKKLLRNAKIKGDDYARVTMKENLARLTRTGNCIYVPPADVGRPEFYDNLVPPYYAPTTEGENFWELWQRFYPDAYIDINPVISHARNIIIQTIERSYARVEALKAQQAASPAEKKLLKLRSFLRYVSRYCEKPTGIVTSFKYPQFRRDMANLIGVTERMVDIYVRQATPYGFVWIEELSRLNRNIHINIHLIQEELAKEPAPSPR